MVQNLFQRNGIWIFRKMIHGKQYCLTTGFRDRRAAERRAMELELEIRKQGLGWAPKPVVTFKQWAERYARIYSPRKRSAPRDRQILAHVAPLWDRRPIDAITRSDCVAYMHRREIDGAKPWTIVRELGFLKAVFNAAIQEGLVKANPWAGIKRPRTEPRSRVLTTDEQAALFSVLNEEYRRLVTVALGTGLRESELLGLRPHDVDMDTGVIRVRAETAKGGKSRTVPVVRAVADALDEQARMKSRTNTDRFWGQCQSSVWRCITSAAKRTKIAPLCVHDLRRTFGTRCALAGMPLPQLQAIMGHHSPTVTMRYYVHVAEADMQRALNRVELGLGKPDDQNVVRLTPQSKSA